MLKNRQNDSILQTHVFVMKVAPKLMISLIAEHISEEGERVMGLRRDIKFTS